MNIDTLYEDHPSYLSDQFTNNIDMGAQLSPELKTKYLPFITRKFGTVSEREMARILGIGKTTVNRWSKELGYKHKKHTVDENFFDKWSENMAYILGFVFADGNVSWNIKKSYWSLTITASEKDKEHLERMRVLIKSTKPLLYSPKTKSYRLIANSKLLCRKLMSMGVIPRKSLKIKFPAIPKYYLKDFIRGVIDGDGNVRFVERERSPYFEITISSGSKVFLKKFAESIKFNFDINANIRKVADHVYIAQYSCTRGLKLADTVYKNSKIFLRRKYNAYEKSKMEVDKNVKNKFVHVGIGNRRSP